MLSFCLASPRAQTGLFLPAVPETSFRGQPSGGRHFPGFGHSRPYGIRPAPWHRLTSPLTGQTPGGRTEKTMRRSDAGRMVFSKKRIISVGRRGSVTGGRRYRLRGG